MTTTVEKAYKTNDVLHAGMKIFNMTDQQLRRANGGRNGTGWIEARAAIWLAIYELAGVNYKLIAYLCSRDRSTISVGIKKYHQDHTKNEIYGWLELVRRQLEEVTS